MKLLASLIRRAVPIVAPIIVGVVTAKVQDVADKAVEKAGRPKT